MKHVRAMLGWLLLGAVVNVLVAWGLGLATPDLRRIQRRPLGAHSDEKTWALAIWASLGRLVFNLFLETDTAVSLGSGRSDFVPEELLPSWAIAYALATENRCSLTQWHLVAYGWPTLALWSGTQLCDEDANPLNAPIARHDVTFINGYFLGTGPIARPDDLADMRRIPYGPIWSGLAVNTLFYAAVLFIPVTGWRAARRTFRRRRGRCVRCGYDLRGNEHGQCPECGSRMGESK